MFKFLRFLRSFASDSKNYFFSLYIIYKITFIKKVINHKEYALIDILQSCPSFNKVNTYKWFNEKTYKLSDSYNPENRTQSFEKSFETNRFSFGIFYIHKEKTIFGDNCGIYEKSQVYLLRITLNKKNLWI